MWQQDNFIHGDLHPGNIFVRFVGKEPKVILLDVGMTAELNAQSRAVMLELFKVSFGYWCFNLTMMACKSGIMTGILNLFKIRKVVVGGMYFVISLMIQAQCSLLSLKTYSYINEG